MQQHDLAIVQQANASAQPTTALQQLSPPEVFAALAILLAKTQRRYPHQDMSQAAPEYLEDFEILAQRYSLRRVERAIRELRLNPSQRFFPAPNEVAAEIEAQLVVERRLAREQEAHEKAEQENREAVEKYEMLDQWKKSGLTATEFRRLDCIRWKEKAVDDARRTEWEAGREQREAERQQQKEERRAEQRTEWEAMRVAQEKKNRAEWEALL